MESFGDMLSGGHPNSLGRTLEVVAAVEAAPERIQELFACYRHPDPIVRLRTSNGLKRICKAHPDWVVPLLPVLLTEIKDLDQASAQWTLATLFGMLQSRMSRQQAQSAVEIMKHNLVNHKDWIVLNNTMQVLFDWDTAGSPLRDWLLPQLERLTQDTRKSVSGRAQKLRKLAQAAQ